MLSPVLCYSKKKTFEEIAKKTAAKTNYPVSEILRLLIDRENMGSTYIANGFAFPHCVIPDSAKECAILVILEKPVHYNFIDNSYADIILAFFLHKETIVKYEAEIQKIPEILSSLSATKNLRYIKNIASQVYSAVIKYTSVDIDNKSSK